MKIATILFTYNRPHHTEKVLEALSKNTMKPQKLIIFQDGMKPETDIRNWNDVNKIIHNVTWCDTEIYVDKKNKGLADSIVQGVNYVLETNEAVTVLEDDCITHPLYLEYMYKCLEKYETEKEVFSINGYTWDADIESNGKSAFFCGRAGSWGWGTWKDRWKNYKEDYKLISAMKKDKHLAEQLEIWGQDFEGMLLGNVKGTINSWNVFWGLNVIKNSGYCVTPFYSLVKNIGCDGTGVHCGKSDVKQKIRAVEDMSAIILPDDICFPKNYKNEFKKFFSYTLPEVKLKEYNNILEKWVLLHQKNKSIAEYLRNNGVFNISIWGRGKIGDLLVNELKNEINIISIIMGKGICEDKGEIPEIEINEITNESEMIIVVPIYDYEMIQYEIRKYIDCKIVALDNLLDMIICDE